MDTFKWDFKRITYKITNNAESERKKEQAVVTMQNHEILNILTF